MITEQRRKQLDDIVQKMVVNKEDDKTIKLVVDDFVKKYQSEKSPLKSGVTGFGQTIGEAIAVNTKDVKSAQESQTRLDDMNVKVGEAIIAGKKLGKDTSSLEELYKNNTGKIFNLAEIAPSTTKTTKQIIGEGVSTLGATMLGSTGASVAGRLALGATEGGLVSSGKSMGENKSNIDNLKDLAKGGAIG